MNIKNKTAYFEWLRLLASAAVVLMHTAAGEWSAAACGSAPWRAMAVWDSLVRWPVPVFVMITGAIFLPRRTGWRTIFTRYIPRMLLCFLVFSGLFTLYSCHKDPSADAWLLLVSGQYHLWYLPFLCGVYLILPFLQKLCEDDRLAGALTALALVFGSAVPWGLDLLALLLPEGAAVFSALRQHLSYTFFLDLLGALLLGHLLHSRELPKGRRLALYGAGLLSAAVTMTATVGLSLRAGAPVSLFFEHSSPLNLCTAAAVFVFAKYRLTRLPGAAGALAGLSFGIYLSHALVLELLADLGLHVLAFDPLWSVPVLAAAVFALSAALTAVLKRLPVLGKYLT